MLRNRGITRRAAWSWSLPAVALIALSGLAGLGVAPTPAQARQAETAPAYVTVNGRGAVDAPPDTATVTIGIDVIRTDLAEAQSEATRQATDVINALKSAGIAPADIQTASYSVNVQRDYSGNGDPTRITGFQVMNQVYVTVREVEGLGDLLGEAVAAGANSIWGVTFSVSDPKPFAADARKLAVADARDRAEQLAAASGLTLGRLVSVSEGAQPYVPGPYYGGQGGGMGGGGSAAPVETGMNEVAVNVVATWELE
ncbi:MAG: SIMPL domain-containing protein [Chloroflexota bacterium]